jgi:hypothetical protein
MTCSITPPDGCLELVHRIEPILDPVSCTARDTNIKAHSVLLLQMRVSSVARCKVRFGKLAFLSSLLERPVVVLVGPTFFPAADGARCG